MAEKKLMLFHPDSPGMRVPVMRGWLGRLVKPADFATTSEVLTYYRALELVTSRDYRGCVEREHASGVKEGHRG
jgi:hypothetical protein